MTAMPPFPMTPAPTDPGDAEGDHAAADHARRGATTGQVPGAATGPVVFLHCAGTERLHRHELVSKSALAEAVARLVGRAYGGHFRDDFAYAGAPFFVPSETLTAAEAARFGIREASELFGGVVPQAFVGTKVITHGLAAPDAAAPEGWQPRFGERVADVVLPGFTAFDPASARQAGGRLLQSGSVRLKRPDGVGGRGQLVIRDRRQLEEALAAVDPAQLAGEGVVLEANLFDVRTFSVGQASLGGILISYCGTQRLTRANDGSQVYGGSELLVARGGWDDLLALQLAPQTRIAIDQARTYHEAAQDCFAGMFATRSNYDVAQGYDEAGTGRSGVLEQSWRIGGATGAEVAAIGAFLADPTLRSIGASTTELYGEYGELPDDAVIYFQGDDDVVGPLVKYARLHPRGTDDDHP